MSNTQFAFIDEQSIPNRQALQKSIDKLGFDLILDLDFTPFKDEGFSPCTLNKEPDVGFEIYYEPAKDVTEDDEEFALIAKNKDFCISLCWQGSFYDYACVMIVSCALVKDFGAIVSYEGEEPESIEKMIIDANDAIKQAGIEEIKEAEIKKAKEEAMGNGNASDKLKELFNSMSKTKLTNISLFHGLDLLFSNGWRFRSNAFVLIIGDAKRIDVTQYAQVRAKQVALMNEINGEEYTEEQNSRFDALNDQLDEASKMDEVNRELFLKEEETWPDEMVVESVVWSSHEKIVIQFSNVPDIKIELKTFDSMLSSININSNLLTFKISPEVCEIV